MTGSGFVNFWRRVGLWALRRAGKKQTAPERLATLSEVQTSVLKNMGKEDAELLREYAAQTTAICVRRLRPRDQVRVIVGGASRALKQVDRHHVYHACASLSDLVRIHPRMIDGASFNARSNDERPLVVGPWLMEVGFELLYWIPYLRAQIAALGIAKDRVIAVSRGGADLWYADIAGRYLDVLDVMTPHEFHEWTSTVEGTTANRKPFMAGPFETEILERVLNAAGIDDYQFILPSAMYGLLRNVWRSRFGAHRLDRHLTPARLQVPPPVKLPFKGPYVAVKFYNSLTFPDAPETRRLALAVVRGLANRSHVVLLSNPARLDDHHSLGFADVEGPFRVFDASSLYSPRDNLAVQTALVAGAQSLHGTYGGFSYLGPLLGVDTFAYTANFDFTLTHLDLAWTMFEALKAGHLAVVPAAQGLHLFAEAEAAPRNPKSGAAA